MRGPPQLLRGIWDLLTVSSIRRPSTSAAQHRPYSLRRNSEDRESLRGKQPPQSYFKGLAVYAVKISVKHLQNQPPFIAVSISGLRACTVMLWGICIGYLVVNLGLVGDNVREGSGRMQSRRGQQAYAATHCYI